MEINVSNSLGHNFIYGYKFIFKTESIWFNSNTGYEVEMRHQFWWETLFNSTFFQFHPVWKLQDYQTFRLTNARCHTGILSLILSKVMGFLMGRIEIQIWFDLFIKFSLRKPRYWMKTERRLWNKIMKKAISFFLPLLILYYNPTFLSL